MELTPNEKYSMKIFAAGIATETNTFSPIPTALEDFRVQRGREILAGQIRFPSLDLTDPWGHQAAMRGDEFIFSLMAYADPAGLTVDVAYETLRDEILGDLGAAMPVDIVLLLLHGAMVAQGYEDCEEDLIRRVREVAGPKAIIAVELDLHCHLSEVKIAAADLVITYKEYPHTDPADRARELFDLAVATRLGKIRPTMALFECRMVGVYPTSQQPMRAFVDSLRTAEQLSRVLSLSFGHGFQFADVPNVGANLLAVTDGDPALARQLAHEYGLKVYALRQKIGCESFSLPISEALTHALSSATRPVVVADQSDNPGGGAPADATYVLRWLLEHQVEGVGMAFFYDPEVIRIARRAGKGARLPVRLGGKLGPTSGDPVDLEVSVLGIIENYQQPFPLPSGETIRKHQGAIVALRSAGIDLIVTDGRGQCLSPAVFSDLGIDPEAKRLLIVKSTQHFHAAFARIAGEIVYMSAPGALAPDPRELPYRRLVTHRLYPWTEDPLNNKQSSGPKRPY
jgi:microcystin degradation protein MlrC